MEAVTNIAEPELAFTAELITLRDSPNLNQCRTMLSEMPKLRHLEGGGVQPVTALLGQYINENIAGRRGNAHFAHSRFHFDPPSPLKRGCLVHHRARKNHEHFDSALSALFVKHASSIYLSLPLLLLSFSLD